ncbi:MAG: hypothetical protein NTU41_11060 [Chloroflexi bacterium]|nr:hypothetical protein [Chloroflexota bacterium]
MKTTLILLANSERPGGRCIAGINPKTGWLRPVSRNSNRAIPDTAAMRQLRLLDIVEVPLSKDRPMPVDKYQIENIFVDSWDWQYIGSCPVNKMMRYCQTGEMILYSHTDRVDPSMLESLPKTQWRSLELVKANVSFSRDGWESNRWRAMLKDGDGHLLSLKVTDPAICDKLNRGDDVAENCLLTVSLAGPWAPPDGSQIKQCYKLVAGVLEL